MSGRFSDQNPPQGRLQFGPKFVGLFGSHIRSLHKTQGGPICPPQETKKNWTSLYPGTPLRGPGSRCPEMPLVRIRPRVCKSPLVGDPSISAQAEGESTREGSSDVASLGFSVMVAPTNKTAGLKIPPFQGMFQNCLAESMPPPKWPLVSLILSGKAFRGNKSRLRTSTFIWDP